MQYINSSFEKNSFFFNFSFVLNVLEKFTMEFQRENFIILISGEKT